MHSGAQILKLPAQFSHADVWTFLNPADQKIPMTIQLGITPATGLRNSVKARIGELQIDENAPLQHNE